MAMLRPLPESARTRVRWPRLSRTALFALLVAIGLALSVATIVVRKPPLTPEAPPVDPVVARVNGEAIHERDVRRLLADPAIRLQLQSDYARRQPAPGASSPQQAQSTSAGTEPSEREFERLALRRLIVQRLLVDEANRRQMTAAEPEVKAALASVQRRFKDAEAYEAWRRGVGLEEQMLMEVVRAEVLAARARVALMNEALPTEAQVRAYYDANKADMKTPGKVRLQVMAAPDAALAQRLVASLNRGEDFKRVAAREKDNGVRAIESEKSAGVETTRLPAEVRTAVEKMKPGRTHAPISSGDEYLVIRLAERQASRPMSFEEARPEIEQTLGRSLQRQQLSSWLAEQRKTAKVEILRPQLTEN